MAKRIKRKKLLALVAETLDVLRAAMNNHENGICPVLSGRGRHCTCGANAHNDMLNSLAERYERLYADLTKGL